MSAPIREGNQRSNTNPLVAVSKPIIQPSAQARGCATIPREAEKQKIKRILYSLIDRIEKL